MSDDLREQLVRFGLASKEDAEQIEAEEAVVEETPTFPISDKEIELGVLFIQVFGSAKRALAAVRREQSAPYGRGRQQAGLLHAAEAAAQSEQAKNALATLRHSGLIQTTRARDFDSMLEGLEAALSSPLTQARYDEYRRSQEEVQSGRLDPPAMPEITLEALVAAGGKENLQAQYRQLLVDWLRGLTQSQKEAMGNPYVDQFMYPFHQKVEGCIVAAVEAARQDFESGGRVEEFLGFLRKLEQASGSDEHGRRLCRRTPRTWELLLTGRSPVRAEEMGVLPSDSWLATVQSPRQLVWLASQRREPAERVPILRRLAQAAGLGEQQAYCCSLAERYFYAGTTAWLYAKSSYEGEDPPAEGVYPIQPTESGWVHFKADGKFLFAPTEAYQALVRLQAVPKGMVCIEQGLVHHSYGRHPEKGYPRFVWGSHAGSRYSSFELPVQLGPVVEQLDDLSFLLRGGLEAVVPKTAWWLNCQLGTTRMGRPRLDNGQPEKRAMLVSRYSSAMRHGRHGWSGDTVTALETPGATVLYNGFVTSGGGGQQSAYYVVWVPEGVTLRLSNGMGLLFDGESLKEVPGGGLDDSENPSL